MPPRRPWPPRVSVTTLAGCGSTDATFQRRPTDGDHQHHQDRRRGGAGESAQARRILRTASRRPSTRARRPARSATPPVTTEVPADPQRIVVLSGDQLDALCALGLQSRIVAAALPDGATGQPSYLGTAVHDLPAWAPAVRPTWPAIQAAAPDLILGSQALTPEAFASFRRSPRRCSPGRPARHGRPTCAPWARQPAASTPPPH